MDIAILARKCLCTRLTVCDKVYSISLSLTKISYL